jgi:hypothetical protein
MNREQKQLLRNFANKYGLTIERFEPSRAVLTAECTGRTGAKYVKCYVRADAKVKVVREDGKMHNAIGPAFEEYGPTGAVRLTKWIQNGLLHREDGPAYVDSSGYEVWYRQGVKHREDGPAVSWRNGDRQYWVNGKFIRRENIYEPEEPFQPTPTDKLPTLTFSGELPELCDFRKIEGEDFVFCVRIPVEQAEKILKGALATVEELKDEGDYEVDYDKDSRTGKVTTYYSPSESCGCNISYLCAEDGKAKFAEFGYPNFVDLGDVGVVRHDYGYWMTIYSDGRVEYRISG